MDGLKIGYLPQEPKLDPTKTVFENIAAKCPEKQMVDDFNVLSAKLGEEYSDELMEKMTKLQEEIDATGQVVTPGFIDGHTHMDAQVFWDPLGSCSCWHGVTTVVMGNCGFTLAPGSAEQRDMILSNIVRAEDISPAAIGAAVRWNWTSFREYMDVVDKLPKTINYASNIGHSSLRTHVMGPRAFEQQASADRDQPRQFAEK